MFEGKLQRYLLPNFFQRIGFFLSIAGIVALYLRFGLGFKPDWLDVKVLAIYSSIFEARYFAVVGNNIGEEIGLILTFSGLFLITISREKTEKIDFSELRLKSFFLAVYANSIFLFISILFIFGWGFMAVMAVNLFSFLFFYNLVFRYLIFSERKKAK